jgi:hypothetical protein
VNAGHDPDDLLDKYSFEQLGLFARCSITHQVKMLNMVLGPVLGASGLGWKPHKMEKQHDPRNHKNSNFNDSEEKEKALLSAMARAPVGMRTIKTSGKNKTE